MRQFRTSYVAVLFAVTGMLVSSLQADEITVEGTRLAEKLDEMDVEHHWEPGRSVAWKTGKLLEKQGEFRKSNTHCSAFVAATCLQLDVYILRPPEHETKNLANAQADWLAAKGADLGWRHIKSELDAQHLANKGKLVVAAFKETNPDRNGHIAIVRPDTQSLEAIRLEGPRIIQAGATNFNNTSVKEGFKHHLGAFPNGVRYYVHEKK